MRMRFGDQVVELYYQGYSTAEIAKMLDRSEADVVNYLVKNHIIRD